MDNVKQFVLYNNLIKMVYVFYVIKEYQIVNNVMQITVYNVINHLFFQVMLFNVYKIVKIMNLLM